jgi:hypothetical protein
MMRQPSVITTCQPPPSADLAADLLVSLAASSERRLVRAYGHLRNQSHCHLQAIQEISSFSLTFSTFMRALRADPTNESGIYMAMVRPPPSFREKMEPIVNSALQHIGMHQAWSEQDREFTIWVSRPGHTEQLHYDSHDNIVIQLAGRKKWLLFPPETKFPVNPIQSKWCNFSTVEYASAVAQKGGMKITVDANSVLFVPAGWWHTVTGIDGDGTEDDLVISANVFQPHMSVPFFRRLCWWYARMEVADAMDDVKEKWRVFKGGDVPVIHNTVQLPDGTFDRS